MGVCKRRLAPALTSADPRSCGWWRTTCPDRVRDAGVSFTN
jgi:hypothetical protein